VPLILLSLLIVPIMEISVFIWIGGAIGTFQTLGLILVTAILGTLLLRWQGLSMFQRIRERTEMGEVPGKELVSGVMIVIAGVLLLTPGFVTDTLGFLLFVPSFRDVIWNAVANRIVVKTTGMPGSRQGHRNPMGGFDRHTRDTHKREPGVVELDPDEFSEKPNPETPWRRIDD